MAVSAGATITLTQFTCGRRMLPFQLGSPGGELVVPVTAYLIEHPQGMAVFDTGLGPRFARPTGETRSGSVDLEEDSLIDARLRSANVDPLQISFILNSHLHSGHAGGNALLPGATVIVQQAEWRHASATSEGDYHAPEFDTGQPVIEITGQHDLFGDGSVVLVPTPGHTPGHQSAWVQTTGGEVLLSGDAGPPAPPVQRDS
jgi:N-acyl homoserine lactone hydrolase